MPTPTPQPIPLTYFAPSGTKIYTGPEDYRAQTLSEPPQANKLISGRFGAGYAKYWVDTSAIQRINRRAEQIQSQGGWRFNTFESFLGDNPTALAESQQANPYTFFRFDLNGNPITMPIDSPEFYATYALTLAHNTVIGVMRQFKHLYEKVGAPVTQTIKLTDDEAAATQFPTQPYYQGYKHTPVIVPSTHVFFVLGKEVVALSIAQFTEVFAPKARTYEEMLQLVDQARQSGASAESQVGMIRLAVIDQPKQAVI